MAASKKTSVGKKTVSKKAAERKSGGNVGLSPTKKAVKKTATSSSKTRTKNEVKKSLSARAETKRVVKQSSAKKTAKVSVAKKPQPKSLVVSQVKKSIQKTGSASPQKTNSKKSAATKAVLKSSVKKVEKNTNKDIAKNKKTSKIDKLLADNKNNKSMQKNKVVETTLENNSKKITAVAVKKDIKKDIKVAHARPATKDSVKTAIVKKPLGSEGQEKEGVKDKDPVVLSSPNSAENVLNEIKDPGFLTNDDVFDEADHAQWQQLREQADIQSRAMQLNRPESHPDFNGKECVECGIEIPLARLKMHKVRCVDCQNELEQERARSQRTTYQSKSISSGWDE